MNSHSDGRQTETGGQHQDQRRILSGPSWSNQSTINSSELTSSSSADTQDGRLKIIRSKRKTKLDGFGVTTRTIKAKNLIVGAAQQSRLTKMMAQTSQSAQTTTTTTTLTNDGTGGAGPEFVGPPPPPPVSGKTTSSDKSTRLLVVLFLIGLIVCVTSITCILLLPSLVSNQIAKKLVLKNNSMLLERWSKPNVPMYFKVWLYDIKNAQEIIDKRDTKPRVDEIGPFVFNLKRQKDVISFAGDNLYYTERKIYHFNRELSCCAINTTVTIPNIPLVAVVDRALGYNLPLVGRFIPRLINRAIQSLREQLFVRKQVREILFDGYDVELLKMVSRIGSLVGLPQQSQKFALLKGRNDTWRPEQDGVWAINTGQRDRRQFGKVSSWNSYKKLPFWSTPQCNVINGSDGTLFPPPIKRSEPLYVFNQELCRSVNLVFDRPSDVRSIEALRFVLNPMNFAHTMTGQQQQASGQSPTTTASLPAAAIARLANINQQANNQRQQQQQPPSIRTRVNPLFQNVRLGQPVEVPPQAPSSRRDDLSEQFGPALAHQTLVRSQQLRNRPQSGGTQQAPTGERTAPKRVNMARTSGSLVQSASQLQETRDEPPITADGGGGGGVINAPLNSAKLSLADEGPAQVAAGAGAASGHQTGAEPGGRNKKESMEATIRGQQEKLIRAAQEAQLANERKSKLNPQTCFCDRKTTNLNGINVCEFDGLIDLSKCSKQAQVIFGSMPHFYNSDPRLLNQVVGLAPNASKHSTYLDIEPNTGLVLGGKRRVQLNVIIKHNNEIDGFENIKDMLVPIVWFEESALIPEETAQKFKSMYVDKIRMINLILISLLTASIALLAVDARLLLATRRWSEFKLMHLSQLGHVATGGDGLFLKGGQLNRANTPDEPSSEKRRRRHQAGVNSSRRQDQRRLDRSLRMASAPLVAQLASSRQASGGGASSPLLLSTSTTATTTTADSSPSVTPPNSPQDSPELRKWSPANGRTLTRIYLSANSNVVGNSQPPVRENNFANEKSIIELESNRANQPNGPENK